MPRAVLILADLHAAGATSFDLAAVPRLPLLEYCLSRARREPLVDGDWRCWLAGRFGMKLERSPVAGRWLATPVHCVAGLDTLRLAADGLLRLPLEEQQRLAEAFDKTFAGSGWKLAATGARELLLSGPAVAAEAPDPARFLGQGLREAQIHGSDAAMLRRLQGEIEMWLYELSFHAESGGQRLKVNGLWLWGSAFAASLPTGDATPTTPSTSADPPPHGEAHILYSDDLAARACASAAGLRIRPLGDHWPDDTSTGDHYVALNLRGSAVGAQLAEIERHWLEPALRWRAAGRYRSVELVGGASRWIFDAASRLRIWRRSRHWLPELLAC